VGDLLWEFRISVDINQKTLKDWYSLNSEDKNDKYFIVPLNDMDVSLLPSFDVRDSLGSALSLLPEEERLMWQVGVIEGYVIDKIKPKNKMSDALKAFLMSYMSSRLSGNKPESDLWQKVKEIRGFSDKAIEDAVKELEHLRKNYGFRSLIKRLSNNWIPLVYVPATDDGGPIIIKYRYLVPTLEDTSKADRSNSCLTYNVVLENIYSAERDYYIIEAPNGAEFLPMSKEKPVEITETSGDNGTLKVDCRMSLSKVMLRAKRKLEPENDASGKIYDSVGNRLLRWVPKRIADNEKEERDFELTYQIFPKTRGLGLPFFIFWTLSLLVIIITLANSLTGFGLNDDSGPSFTTSIFQIVLLLLPLFQFVRNDRSEKDFYRRELMKRPIKLCYAIAIIDCAMLFIWLICYYLFSFSNCLFFKVLVIAGVLGVLGVCICVALWYKWYYSIETRRRQFIKDELEGYELQEFAIEITVKKMSDEVTEGAGTSCRNLQ
jgi:hypothetical protein